MTARRTQAERTAATRDALVLAARGLFATRGYADVSTPEIAAAAAVTRGALYHQFRDKRALFHAVVEAVEVDVMARLATTVTSTDPIGALLQAARAWIALAGDDAEVRRVLLVDAPSVLGWAALRDIAVEHGLGFTEQLLSAARRDLPSRTAAHLVLGALNEAAFLVADGECSVDEASAVLEALIRP